MFGFSIVGLKNTMAMRLEIIGLAILGWVLQGPGLWAQQDVEVVSPTVQQLEFFESKIRPVLVERCYECHSGQTKPGELGGKLRLDSAPAAHVEGCG
jgi:hypothetical protein